MEERFNFHVEDTYIPPKDSNPISVEYWYGTEASGKTHAIHTSLGYSYNNMEGYGRYLVKRYGTILVDDNTGETPYGHMYILEGLKYKNYHQITKLIIISTKSPETYFSYKRGDELCQWVTKIRHFYTTWEEDDEKEDVDSDSD